MLFLAYWEVNENMAEEQRLQIAQKLTSAGLFPPKGVNILRWDTTTDAWGILLMEANSAEDVFRTVDSWRAAGAGFFKSIKTAPALPVQEAIPIVQDIVRRVTSA